MKQHFQNSLISVSQLNEEHRHKITKVSEKSFERRYGKMEVTGLSKTPTDYCEKLT
jgi:hypothetical protein